MSFNLCTFPSKANQLSTHALIADFSPETTAMAAKCMNLLMINAMHVIETLAIIRRRSTTACKEYLGQPSARTAKPYTGNVIIAEAYHCAPLRTVGDTGQEFPYNKVDSSIQRKETPSYVNCSKLESPSDQQSTPSSTLFWEKLA